MRNLNTKDYSSIQYSSRKMNTPISEREGEILSLLSEGQTVKEIASTLYLSPHTIESHKKNLVRKFDARNTAHLVAKFIRAYDHYFSSYPSLSLTA